MKLVIITLVLVGLVACGNNPTIATNKPCACTNCAPHPSKGETKNQNNEVEIEAEAIVEQGCAYFIDYEYGNDLVVRFITEMTKKYKNDLYLEQIVKPFPGVRTLDLGYLLVYRPYKNKNCVKICPEVVTIKQ